MGFLFGSKSKAPDVPVFTGLQVQTSVNTMPIPIMYGTPRGTDNLIYNNGFRSTGGTGGGGKGLFGGGKQGNAQIQYFSTFIAAIGEGQLGAIIAIFQDQKVFTPATIPSSFIYFNGAVGQEPWDYIVEHWPLDAFSYADTAYIGGQDYPLDSSATIPQFNFMIQGFFAGTIPLWPWTNYDNSGPYYLDADLALVIPDLLTNPRYGAGFPASLIDSSVLSTAAAFNPAIGDGNFQTYCQAIGFGASVILNNSETASSIIDRWMKLLVVAPVWNGSFLKFIPYLPTAYGENNGFSSVPATFGPSFAITAQAGSTQLVVIGNFLGNTINGATFASIISTGGANSGQMLGLVDGVLFTDLVTGTNFSVRTVGSWTNPVTVGESFMVTTTPIATLNAIAAPQKKYYNPAALIAVQAYLTDDDFIQASNNEDPLVYKRTDLADVHNTVRLNFRDRYNLGNDNVAEAKDENAIDLYGIRPDWMGNADIFTIGIYPALASGLIVTRNVAIRDNFSFKLNWSHCRLDPMDVVAISDTNLGLNNFLVRITSIEEDEKGILTIEAEELPIVSPVVRDPTSNTSVFVNTGILAPSINTPIIFQPSAAFRTAQGLASPSLVFGLSGGPLGAFSTNWGGATIFSSDDAGVTYAGTGASQHGASTMGLLTAVLPAYGGANPDTTSTLSVDLTESNTQLSTVSGTQAAAGFSLCVVVDAGGLVVEYLSYTSAKLMGSNAYNLTGLYRGLYGSTPSAHAVGSQFLFYPGTVAIEILPGNVIGHALKFKFPSFNIFNSGEQSIADCDVYTFTPL